MSYSVTINATFGSLSLNSSSLNGAEIAQFPEALVSPSPSISPFVIGESSAPQIQAFRARRNKDEDRKQKVLGKMPRGWLQQQNLPPEPQPPELAGPTPAAVYRRVSTAEQKDSSMDRQASVENYARLSNSLIVAVYDDKGKSGRFKAGRPELMRMMKDAKAGKFKKLILETGNRLARDLGLTTSVFRDLRQWGVEIHTPAEGKWHLLHAAFNGVMGQEALENLKMWTRAGLERAVLDGKFPAMAPYGFEKRLGYPGELFVVNEKADNVRWIYSTRAVGVPPAEIKRLLNAKGIDSPKGGDWTIRQVLKILRNPIYIGLLIYFRTKHEKIETDSYTIEKKVSVTPTSTWRVAERPDWEIVKVELWKKVQQLDERRGKQRKRNAKRLLSEAAWCAHCGSPMYMHGRSTEHVRMYCSDKKVEEQDLKRVGKPCHSRTTVLMQCVEVRVIQAVAERMIAVGAQATAEKAYKSAARKEIEHTLAQRKSLEAQLKDIDARFAASFVSAYTKAMPEGAIALLRDQLNEQLATAQSELAALPVIEIPESPLEGVDFGDLQTFLQDFPYCKNFDGTDERESKMVAVFQELVGRIEIDPISARSFNLTIRGPLAHIGRDSNDSNPAIRIEARDVELKVAPGPGRAAELRWKKVSFADIRITDEEWGRLAPSLPSEPIWVEGYPKPIALRDVLDLLIYRQRSNIRFSYLKNLVKVQALWEHPIVVMQGAFEIAKFWNIIDLFAELAAAEAPRLIDGIKFRFKGRRSGDIEDIPAAFDRRNGLKKARALDPNVKLSLPQRYRTHNALS